MNPGVRGRWVALACLLAVACGRAPTPPATADTPWSPEERRLIATLTPLPPVPPAPTNAVADDLNAAWLGQDLFFDPGFSANGQVSCATCHVPEQWFTDGKPRAQGIGQAARNAPTLLGAQFQPWLFHDGRKDSQWAQALGPVEADVEHGFDRLAVAHRLAQHYRAPYEQLFGPLPPLEDTTRFAPHARPVPFGSAHPHQRAWMAMRPEDRDAVNHVFANFGKALAAYERRLVPQEAPFDVFARKLLRNDPSAVAEIPLPAQRGLRAFLGKAQCVNCHNGPLFTDKAFHNLGLPAEPTVNGVDVGRSLGAQAVKSDEFRCGTPYADTPAGTTATCDELRFLNPRFEDFLGAFRTPTLRNVAKTAPYMHTGQLATLADVVAFYRTLPGHAQVGHRELVLTLLDPEVSADDLVAFLQTLTGPLPPAEWLHPRHPAPPSGSAP